MPVSNEDILDLLATAGGLTTPRVATELRISKPAARRRLSDLAEDGLVERDREADTGPEKWELTDDGREVTDRSDLPGVNLS